MKRVFVLIAVLALLIAGTVSALADPIHVGGSFTTSTFSPIHVGGSNAVALGKVPAHANAYGLYEQGVEEPEMVLLSPIHVGGS